MFQGTPESGPARHPVLGTGLYYVDLFTGWRELAPLSIILTPETEVGWEQSREEFSLDVTAHPPFDPHKDPIGANTP